MVEELRAEGMVWGWPRAPLLKGALGAIEDVCPVASKRPDPELPDGEPEYVLERHSPRGDVRALELLVLYACPRADVQVWRGHRAPPPRVPVESQDLLPLLVVQAVQVRGDADLPGAAFPRGLHDVVVHGDAQEKAGVAVEPGRGLAKREEVGLFVLPGVVSAGDEDGPGDAGDGLLEGAQEVLDRLSGRSSGQGGAAWRPA